MITHLQILTTRYLQQDTYNKILTTRNLPQDTYNNLSKNDIIDKNIRGLKIEFGIENIPIENDRFPTIY